VLGIAIATAGMLWLTRLPAHGAYVSDLLPALLPMSIGLGLAFVPITLLGTGGVSDQDAGLASGLFNTVQQVGGSLGLAILSTLAVSRTSTAVANHVTAAAARVAGYHIAFTAAAIMLAVGAVILAVLIPRDDPRPGPIQPTTAKVSAPC